MEFEIEFENGYWATAALEEKLPRPVSERRDRGRILEV